MTFITSPCISWESHRQGRNLQPYEADIKVWETAFLETITTQKAAPEPFEMPFLLKGPLGDQQFYIRVNFRVTPEYCYTSEGTEKVAPETFVVHFSWKQDI